MSTIYFVFSDESGNYKKNSSERFLRRNPYYIRSAYIIYAHEWKKLRNNFQKINENKNKLIEEVKALKEKYSLEGEKNEIKWSHIWQLDRKIKNQKEKKVIDNLIEFVEESLRILHELSYCKIIYTVTFNNSVNRDEKDIKKWHIQDMMQRVQMEIQDDFNNLGVLFLDPPSSNRELKEFQEIYKDIFLRDSFIKEYKNLKDTINFEPSHHSVGIQLADYVAGCFNGFLRGFKTSTNLFKKLIYPLLRKDDKNNPLGYGIIEVPKDDEIRQELLKKLEKVEL